MELMNHLRLNMEEFEGVVQQIKELAESSVRSGTAMHIVEQNLLDKLLQLGHAAIHAMFLSFGSGDVGTTVTHADHPKPLKRFPELSNRSYRSVFGDFQLARYVYGKTPKQKAIVIPLDEHFALPPNDYSLLLESWVTQIATSEAIHEGVDKLHRIFGIAVAVDSAERILKRTGANAEHFQDDLPILEAEAEGELLVESTDNKGIVMRRPLSVAPKPVGAPADRSGPISNRKQMATVCGCYSVDRFVRTPVEVLDALFRDTNPRDVSPKRPRPQQARYQACMSCDQAHPEDSLNGEISAIAWLSEHVEQRRRDNQVLINLNDGEVSIWSNIERSQGQNDRVDVLDLIHGIQRVWDAAEILSPMDKVRFAKSHIKSILQGKVKSVIRSFRWKSTHLALTTKQRQKIATICGFLTRNADRMRYDDYLSKGYPIASGFIEGACRHLVKDRMERSGMRWSIQGAQHMLYFRCIDAASLWKDFMSTHQTRTLSHYGERRNFNDAIQLAA